MVKFQKKYAVIPVVTAVCLFLSGSRFLFALLILEMIFPVGVYLLLRIDIGGISLNGKVRHPFAVGQTVQITLEMERKKALFMAGVLDIVLEYDNSMFGIVQTETVRFPLFGMDRHFEIPFQAKLCGEIYVRTKKVICQDMFGLWTISLSRPGDEMITVYPRRIPLNIIWNSMASGDYEGESYYQSHKGNDIREVFEMRDYVPGDDVRRIHWKLSGKMDTLITREGSDTSHYDTVVLFDIGSGLKETKWAAEVLSAAVEAGVTVCEKLLELGLFHDVAIPSEKGIQMVNIGTRADFNYMMDIWMGIRMPEQSGTGIRYFQMERLEKEFSRIIYVTAGGFSEELYKMADTVNMTAVCICEEGRAVYSGDHGKSRLIEIPCDRMEDSRYSILI